MEGQIDDIRSRPLVLIETRLAANTGDNATGSKIKWLRACQLRVHSDCTVEVAPRLLAPVVRADAASGDMGEVLPLDAAVSDCDLILLAFLPLNR